MSAIRPGEDRDVIATSWVPSTTAGLSMTTNCRSALYWVSETSELLLLDLRDNNARAAEIRCQPTELSIKSANGNPTEERVLVSRCPSSYSNILNGLDAAATMIACCPEDPDLIGNSCVSAEDAGEAAAVRSQRTIDIPVTPPASRSQNARLRERPEVKRQDSAQSDSITTTITPILITPGATADPTSETASAAAASSLSLSSSSSPSLSSSISITTPTAQIISSTSTTNPSASYSTITNIPLLVATGSLSTIYSIASSSLPTQTASASNSDSSSGLSVGAKVGITLGVVIAVIGIGCLLAFLHIRRRRRLKSQEPRAPSRGEKKRQRREVSQIEVGNLENGKPSEISTSVASPTPEEPTTVPRVTPPPAITVSPQIQDDYYPPEKTEAPPANHPALHTGPHELDTGEKFELDAGYTGDGASTIDSLSRGASPDLMVARSASFEPLSRGPQPTLSERPSVVGANRRDVRDRTGSIGERVRTPDTFRSRGTAPVSIFNSRSATPENRDARERAMGIGHVSPMSAATERSERSFLDLD